jgi:methylglutaconyl-CoA hydratase
MSYSGYMAENFLEYKIENQLAKIILNRPEKGNALNAKLIAKLQQAFDSAISDDQVRIILLCANGNHFSAGADLNWMAESVKLNQADNIADARKLAQLLKTIYDCPKPTVGAIQGKVYGGAVGFVAALDLCIALDDSFYCCSEALLGLVPAMVSPYIVAAIGNRRARELFLTAREFSATEALNFGLVNSLCGRQELESVLAEKIRLLLLPCPIAQASAKTLLRKLADVQITDAVIDYTAKMIASLRTSQSAQTRITKFLNDKNQKNSNS